MKSLSKWRWCEVETMCGRSLKEGVMFVGLSSLIKGNIFLCSLWYVSHLSLLTIYCLLFISKIVVYCQYQDYSAAALTIAIGIIYEVTFTYFAIVVNSYLHSLNQERYL
nr:uncharacterized protein LOC116770708 isoform X3 [Danaus plexippus plexippus]